MRRDDIAVAGIWFVCLIITVAAVIYGFNMVVAAIVGASSLLLAAILTHALASLREQRLELQKQKQRNYSTLVAKLAPFVRNASAESDEFTAMHLYSWVVGSPEVIGRTREFMDDRNEHTLRELLLAMREDVGLEAPGEEASVAGLLGPKPQPGHIAPGGGHAVNVQEAAAPVSPETTGQRTKRREKRWRPWK